ncbi:hypothetical protein ACFSTC_01745 [Nonomuraea ferruginea]
MGTSAVSPDGTMLAYSTDFTGDERFTLRFKDLRTGELLPDEIEGIFYGGAWSADGSTFFYTRVDDAWRPFQVYRHTLGTGEDTLVYQEDDERFWVGIALTRSERYLVLGAGSKITSEVRLLDAATPSGEFQLVRPRKTGVEYGVDHAGGFFYVLHNENARDFELATAPLDDPGEWTPLVPHRDDTRLLEIDAFAGHAVLHFRRDGLTGLRVLPHNGEPPYEIEFPEPLYDVGLGQQPRVRDEPAQAGLHQHGDARQRLRLRPGHPRADPVEAAAGAGRLRPGRLRAVPRLGDGRGRHRGAGLDRQAQGQHAPGADGALRVRQL